MSVWVGSFRPWLYRLPKERAAALPGMILVPVELVRSGGSARLVR